MRSSNLQNKKALTAIVNSSDSTDHYNDYLTKGADYVVLGEGETTLNELINSLNSNNHDPSIIKGIAYSAAGSVKLNPGRPVLQDLDSLPLPAWDLVDIDSYKKIWINGNGYFSLNIATTRGCPFKCNWCAKPIYGNRYNSRSPEHVANEIQLLTEKFGVSHFWMCDDIFGLKPGWAQEFAKITSERNLSFKYKIQSRVDLLLKEDTIDALVNSGLDEVWVGAESGSQDILNAMDKGITVEQIREATGILKKKGVKVCFFLQFGYLGETAKDIDQTIDMLLELMPDDIGISVSYPLPGTKFYEKVKDDLKQKANWSDSDDLDLMFENNYSRNYYKKLHRYVHKKYRKKQGWLRLTTLLNGKTKISGNTLRSIFLSLFYYSPALIFDKIQLQTLQKR